MYRRYLNKWFTKKDIIVIIQLEKMHVKNTFPRSIQDIYRYICYFNKRGLWWELYEQGGIDTDKLYNFLEKYITNSNKKKLIILDNASCHRNERIKELITKNNILLYSVPYQHYTNAIEGIFNVLKSRLQKLEGLKPNELRENIKNVVSNIPTEIFIKLFDGSYKREKYSKKASKRTKKIKNYL